jgi:hypothetical protein
MARRLCFALYTIFLVLVMSVMPASAAGDITETTAVSPTSTMTATPTQKIFFTLSITSDPPGADVYYDGEYIGKTPLAGFETARGDHSLTITKDGFKPASIPVVIQPGSNDPVEIFMPLAADEQAKDSTTAIVFGFIAAVAVLVFGALLLSNRRGRK